ncbi:MAG TPA: FTR1 family protein [Vicinamibacterales bacterium]|nr:FTR1 family protein [Vicinamibacterales bacterium]
MTATVPSVSIAILVFREGLECILVLAAICAGLTGANARYRRPILLGALIAFAATVLTWNVAIQIIDDLTEVLPALQVQAATGLLAVCVLLVVMNWFFHKLYWTGWISLHTDKKRRLLARPDGRGWSARLVIGLGLLGFTSLYREGVEVVLFLQSYRLRLGAGATMPGLYVGLALTIVVGVLTFALQRHLPYKKMLIATGVLLAMVLFVMVGEQAQEMQQAHWLPTTAVPWLEEHIPGWMELWFSIFPTVEGLVAQALAIALVLGSYFAAETRVKRRARIGSAAPSRS